MLSALTASSIFLVVTIDPGGEDTVRELLGDISGIERTVGTRIPGGALALVTGIGSDAWDRLFSGPRPADLHPFVELRGPYLHDLTAWNALRSSARTSSATRPPPT